MLSDSWPPRKKPYILRLFSYSDDLTNRYIFAIIYSESLRKGLGMYTKSCTTLFCWTPYTFTLKLSSMKQLFTVLLILCSSYTFAQKGWVEKYPTIDMSKFDWGTTMRFPSAPEAGEIYSSIGYITNCPVSRDVNGTFVPFTTSVKVYIITDKGMVSVPAKGTAISTNIDTQELQFVKNQSGSYERNGNGYIYHYDKPMAVSVEMDATGSQVEYRFSAM